MKMCIHHIINCEEEIKAFHKKHPERPKGLHGAQPLEGAFVMNLFI